MEPGKKTKEEEEKEAFFDELCKLDEQSDEEHISNAASVLESVCHTGNEAAITDRNLPVSDLSRSPKKPVTKAGARPGLIRISSDPSPRIHTSDLAEVAIVKDTPNLLRRHSDKSRVQRLRPSATRSHTDLDEAGPSMASKKRRVQKLKLASESQQIFKDLVFFFIPNDDVAGARRMRINKSKEYGATWARAWSKDVSHVIVDKGLTFKDVMSFLKLEVFPSGVTLVNESYPADCIRCRLIVDPSPSRFQVTGAQEALAPAHSASSTTPSTNTSLPLKPSKDDFVRPPQTPSRTEDSIQSVPALQSTRRLSEELTQEVDIDKEGTATNTSPKDELDEAISEMKATADVLQLLDPGADDNLTTSMSSRDSDSDSKSTSDDDKPKRKRSKVTKDSYPQSNFTCMQKHDGTANIDNPNGRTIEVLQQMATYYDRIDDHWRTTAYRKAISCLRQQTVKVTTREQALQIPYIGDRLAKKIEEIVWTNNLRRLEHTTLDPNDLLLQKFMQVYGAGFSQASKWIAQGHRSLQDLMSNANLTKNQKVGVEHYDDFLQRIPRAEVEAHGKIVRDALHKVDRGIQVTIGGSYRRGGANSGDIDLIITKPDSNIETLRNIVLATVVPRLFNQNFLQASLASASGKDGSKWHGASVLPESTVWRRIDLLFVPWEEIGAALIFFTGNDIFNRSVRLLASKRGMRLNQHGLYRDVMRGPGRARITEGTLVEGQDERRIFRIMGVPWRPPEHRIC